MAWDSYTLSGQFASGVNSAEIEKAFIGQLNRLGSVKTKPISSGHTRIYFRPKSSLQRAVCQMELNENKRTGDITANVFGKTNISLFWIILIVLACIMTSGLLFPIFLILLIIWRKKPREGLEDALRSAQNML